MEKIIIRMIFLIMLVIFSTSFIHAADMEIVCNGKECTGTAGSLFSSDGVWYPGKSVAKTVQVKNTNRKDDLMINTVAQKFIKDPSTCAFDSQMILSITELKATMAERAVWSGSLRSFYDSPRPVELITLSPGLSADLRFVILFNQDASDECQNKKTELELVLNFTGGKLVGKVLGTSTRTIPVEKYVMTMLAPLIVIESLLLFSLSKMKRAK